MNGKIGIIKDREGRITDLYGMDHIDIYEQKEGWETVMTLEGMQADTAALGAIRIFLEEMIKRLGDCRILVGTAITGMPYHILDRNGFILCEAEESSQTLLEEVYKDYCMPKEQEKEPEIEYVPVYPQPADNDGNFFFDFIAVQKSRPEVTSKKALLPFLSHELFQTLTILCSHVMPWLEKFAADRGLELSTKREDGKYLVVVSHKQCNE